MLRVSEWICYGLVSGYLIECFPNDRLIMFNNEPEIGRLRYLRDSGVDDMHL